MSEPLSAKTLRRRQTACPFPAAVLVLDDKTAAADRTWLRQTGLSCGRQTNERITE